MKTKAKKKVKPVDTIALMLQQAEAASLPGARIRIIRNRSVWKRLAREVKHES